MARFAGDYALATGVTITVFRRDRLLEIPVTLGQKPLDAVYLAKVERPTEQQKASYQAWMGAPFDGEPAEKS